MANEKSDFVVPRPPQHLPAEEQARWSKTYEAAHRDAETDHPGDAIAHKQHAMREANRLLRVPVLKSYEDAMSLKDWQVVLRKEQGGKLKVVTADGKGYVFDVAAPAPSSPPPGPDKEKK